MMTDPSSDMLTRIRNAQAVRKLTVEMPYSKLKKEIAKILEQEGYVQGSEVVSEGVIKALKVQLQYEDKKPRITSLIRISKPGRRVYCAYKELPRVLNGLGIAIISTPKGLMTNQTARKEKVGGEILCEIY